MVGSRSEDRPSSVDQFARLAESARGNGRMRHPAVLLAADTLQAGPRLRRIYKYSGTVLILLLAPRRATILLRADMCVSRGVEEQGASWHSLREMRGCSILPRAANLPELRVVAEKPLRCHITDRERCHTRALPPSSRAVASQVGSE